MAAISLVFSFVGAGRKGALTVMGKRGGSRDGEAAEMGRRRPGEEEAGAEEGHFLRVGAEN